MKHTQLNINHKTYKNMHDTISKYVLSLGLFVLLAGDCNPTPDTKSEEAFFKQIAFTAHNVKYDFHLTPAPGTLSINDQSVSLANAQQTASGATLVVDGKTYGIAYRNINDTVYLTLTLPDDVGSLPTSITLHTLLASEKSTLVDQNGAPITEGQSLSRRNDAFIAKIISEDGKKNTIYNIQLKKETISPPKPTISTLVLTNSLTGTNAKTFLVDITNSTVTILVPTGATPLSKAFIKELRISPEDVPVFDQNGKKLGVNSSVAIQDNNLILHVGSDPSKPENRYEIQVEIQFIDPSPVGSVISSITLTYLDRAETEIELDGKNKIIYLNKGERLPSKVTINSYQLATNSEGAIVSLTPNGNLLSSPTPVTLDGKEFKLYVTPKTGKTATEYTITFREDLYTGNRLTSFNLTFIVHFTLTFAENERTKEIALPINISLPIDVKVSNVIVSDGATVEILKGATVRGGGTKIPTNQETTISVNKNEITFKVTSQSGKSTDYTIVFSSIF